MTLEFVVDMDSIAEILRFIGYHAALIYPMLPTYALLLFSAITPIYTGAHASLTRPASTAKPIRRSTNYADESEDAADDTENTAKMEGLGPMDAILMPVFAGLTLGGLYLLIKWLDDPAILSKILSAYFSLAGTVAIAKLGTDVFSLVHGVVFPDIYRSWGTTWTGYPEHRVFRTSAEDGPAKTRSSPMPGLLSMLPLPGFVNQSLWAIREAPYRKFRVRIHVHNFISGSLKIGLFDITAAVLAVAMSLYTNFIHAPWYLNNLSAFAFVYSVFQLVTPTTAWTASLIISGLFFYDIYFVFYTPLMVTVATNLDIPAKMLFPRPEGMSMLGLGDIAIPGMIVGFALRFDLWLHYFRQQRPKSEAERNGRVTRSASKHTKDERKSSVVKPKYHSATGHWGTRFWAGSLKPSDPLSVLQGKSFPKPYFYATVTGYLLGLICTLLVMQIFMHAQPALLYLAPCVVGPLWITALARGEAGILWRYRDDVDDDGFTEKEEEKEDVRSWTSLLGSIYRHSGDRAKERDQPKDMNGKGKEASEEVEKREDARKDKHKDKREFWHKNQIIYFSVSFPCLPPSRKPVPEAGASSSSRSSSADTPKNSPKRKANGAVAGVKRRRVPSNRTSKRYTTDSEDEDS